MMSNCRYSILILSALFLFSCGNEEKDLPDLGLEFFVGSEKHPGGRSISSWKDSSQIRMIHLEKIVNDLNDDWEYLFDELSTTHIDEFDHIYKYSLHFKSISTDDIIMMIQTYYYDAQEWEPVLLKSEKYLIDGQSHKAKELSRFTVWDDDFDG